MKTFNIAVLPGDGIGPEIMKEALIVLEKVSKAHRFFYTVKEGYIGGAAIDRFDTPLPEETLETCRSADAILLGCIGGPQWDHLPPPLKPELGGLLALRKSLNLYANLRPVKIFEALKPSSPLAPSRMEEEIDLLTVRELSSGIYFGEPRLLDESQGLDTMRYRKEEVERIAKTAFEIAENRRKNVISVDKANVLHSSMLWRKTVSLTASQYPDVRLRHMYVDNAAMQMVLNPAQFDVILTSNLFGDILSDESAALCGSLGMLPSASLGETIHLYEPAGGSAPDIAGRGIANPCAQILSAAMMLDYSFEMPEASRDIFNAVEQALNQGFRTRDIASDSRQSVTTAEMCRAICRFL